MLTRLFAQKRKSGTLVPNVREACRGAQSKLMVRR